MKRLRGEEGIALVTAVLALFVVTSLAAVGFGLASHNLDQSAQDRRRVQAIHAAEGGIDWFLQYLSKAPTTSVPCASHTESVTTSPASSFTATPHFYTSVNSTTDLCPTTAGTTGAVNPGAILIRSVGTSNGISRTMEGWYSLSSSPGGSPLGTGVIWSNGDATLTGGSTVFSADNSGDVYTNGSLVLSSGGGVIQGSVSAPNGSINMSGAFDVKKDVVAGTTLTTSGGANIRGNGYAYTNMSNGATITGSAYYCGSYSGGGSYGAKTQMTSAQCTAGPPKQTWPDVQFTYTPSDWSGGGYQIKDFVACGSKTTDAEGFILGAPGVVDSSGQPAIKVPGVSYVVHIDSTCELNINVPVTVTGNLAVVSRGPLVYANKAWTASPPAGSTYDLFLMFNVATPAGCNNPGITFQGGASVSSAFHALLYTPCNILFSGGSTIDSSGYLRGNKTELSGSSTLSYFAIAPPGHGGTGFISSMQYRREVI